MRLSPGRWGNHRKVGSAGARGNTKVNLPNWYNELSGRPLKGRRGPGQLGGADTVFWGRKVLRMNTEHQLIWVLGTVAGEIGSWARVYDSRTTKNDVGKNATISSAQNKGAHVFSQLTCSPLILISEKKGIAGGVLF